jgi:hypothetical protein
MAICEHERGNIQHYSLTCSFVWVSNLVSTLVEGHRPEEFQNRFLRKVAGDGANSSRLEKTP